MPLVECQDCSTPVSTQALACPRCGRPSPVAIGTSRLIIRRRSSRTGSQYDVSVAIDGKPVGKIADGCSLMTETRSGNRLLELRGGGMTASTLLSIRDEGSVECECYFSDLGILGGGLVIRVLGAESTVHPIKLSEPTKLLLCLLASATIIACGILLIKLFGT